jgi:thiosulfate reductase cytochrome b subunit
LIVLTGLVSSPRGEALLPLLAAFFGTRQTAKAIHFDIAILLIAYTAVHLFMVLLTGFRNNVRSMLTGWYRLTPSGEENKK